MPNGTEETRREKNSCEARTNPFEAAQAEVCKKANDKNKKIKLLINRDENIKYGAGV